MNREPFRRDSRITGGQRESPSLHESSLRSSYVNPLSDSNDLPNDVQPSSYMQRSPSPVRLPRRPTLRSPGHGQHGEDGLSVNTTPSGSIDSATQDRQRSAASSVSSGRGYKPYKQQPWADERIDMTPLGLGQSAPWPEIPLSPMARGGPGAAGQNRWHASQDPRSDSLSADEEGSEHSDPAHAANPRTPVLDKTSSSMYVDSALPEQAAGPSKSGSDAPWGSQRKGGGGCLAAAWHHASLGFAEHPLRKHREWTGSVVPYNTLEARHSRSGSRANGDAYDEEAAAFAGAVPAKRRLFPGCGMASPEQPPRTLEERYAKNNKRRRLLYALRRRKSSNSFRNRWDCICNEVFIAGELMFDKCTPSTMKHHLPWFTAAYLALQFITFAYMAGQYASFLGANPGISSCGTSDFEPGPHGMFRWVDTWVPCYVFHPSFLTMWGAKYAPLMRQAGNWWRWLSSLVVQDSFPHLLATALLYGALSLHVEHRYGTRRTVLLTVTAAVAGNFLDTLIMDPCTVVLASAGCTFALFVPFLADTAFNFDAISYPVLRLLGVAAALALYIAAGVLTGYPGRLVPLGAVLASCFPGLLMLPHLKSEKYEWWVPYCALLTSVVLLLVVPIAVYAARFPPMSC